MTKTRRRIHFECVRVKAPEDAGKTTIRRGKRGIRRKPGRPLGSKNKPKDLTLEEYEEIDEVKQKKPISFTIEDQTPGYYEEED